VLSALLVELLDRIRRSNLLKPQSAISEAPLSKPPRTNGLGRHSACA